MFQPDYEACRALRDRYDVIPISAEIMADVKTPIQVLRLLQAKSKHCFLLESMEEPERWGRYTFLAYDPSACVTCKDGVIEMVSGEVRTRVQAPPKEYLETLLAGYRSPRFDYLPSFTGGLVGYFSYDYIQYAEPTLKLDAQDTEGFHDLDLMLFEKVIAFDHLKQKIILIANAKTGELETSYPRAVAAIREMMELIGAGDVPPAPAGRVTSAFRPLFSKDAYCDMVEKAKHYIREGDIFQVVLSNRLEADYEGSLLNAYRVLRTVNPSPYMFYFSGSEVEIAGASPETLVKKQGETLYTFPLAGTRPRGRTPEEDAALEEELLADPKELSEHNMLVDLGRNDLGKISKFGSVEVEKYMSVQRYSHVMHIGSTVRGTIRPDCTALDAVDAVLPAGTLSGAPKIRACEIINELEDNKRGIYGGAIGYLDFTGNLDTCIAIRIAYKKDGKVFVRSGGGIVADSVPEAEYQESVNKAQAVMNALEAAGEVDAL